MCNHPWISLITDYKQNGVGWCLECGFAVWKSDFRSSASSMNSLEIQEERVNNDE